MPIEIKYGKIETGGVTAFLRKYKMAEGLIISRDKAFVHEEKGRRIRVVPAYEYFASKEPIADSEG